MPQPELESELTCSQCSTKNPPNAKFCFQCGQVFSRPDPLATPTGLSALQKTILVIALAGLVVVFLVYGIRDQQRASNRSAVVSTPAQKAELQADKDKVCNTIAR